MVVDDLDNITIWYCFPASCDPGWRTTSYTRTSKQPFVRECNFRRARRRQLLGDADPVISRD